MALAEGVPTACAMCLLKCACRGKPALATIMKACHPPTLQSRQTSPVLAPVLVNCSADLPQQLANHPVDSCSGGDHLLACLQKLANAYASKPAAGKRKRGAADPALQGQEGIPADLHLQMAAAAAAAAYQVSRCHPARHLTAQGATAVVAASPKQGSCVFWLPDASANGCCTGSRQHVRWMAQRLLQTWPEVVPPVVHQQVAVAVDEVQKCELTWPVKRLLLKAAATAAALSHGCWVKSMGGCWPGCVRRVVLAT